MPPLEGAEPLPAAEIAGPDDADPEDPPESGPIRRSIVTGERLDKARLIRFVVGPAQEIVPDLDEKLPGRGLWVEAAAGTLALALKKRAFDRAARRSVTVPPDLAARIEAMLAARCRDAIGLARRGGHAVCGFEKVNQMVRAGKGAVLLSATEGGRDSRRKLQRLAPDLVLLTVLSGEELGVAFGREHVGHAVLGPGRLAARLLADGGRLAGFRDPAPAA